MIPLSREDFAYPFRVDSASQQTAQSNYADHVHQMVLQLLLTTPGERVNLPMFGCGLRSLVFAGNSDALEATVKLRVIQSLTQWLGSAVTVGDVLVATGAEVGLDPGAMQVTVTYTLVETQTTQTVTVTVA